MRVDTFFMAFFTFSQPLRENPSTAQRTSFVAFAYTFTAWAACSLALVALSGCIRPEHNLGLGLQPASELLSLHQDTVQLELATVAADSVRSDERGLSLIGTSYDPVSGLTKAWFSTQLRLSETGFTFGENATADSAALILMHVSNAAYGANHPQYLEVEQLVDSLSIDSSYYTTDRFDTHGINIAIAAEQPIAMHPQDPYYLGDDTLTAQVRIPLQLEFAQAIVDADSTVFQDNAHWLEYFPGLRVRSVSGGGGIVGIDGISGASMLRLYYHNDSDTSSYDFPINANCARVNQFHHNWSSAYVGLNDSLEVAGDQELCLLGGGGSFLLVKIPGIQGWDSDSLTGRAVNKAELFLPTVQGNSSKLPLPNKLTAILRDPDGGFALAPDLFGLATSYGGQYDAERGGYVLNMPRTIQQMLTGALEQREILLYSELSSVALEQLVVSGHDAENSATFVITYSD